MITLATLYISPYNTVCRACYSQEGARNFSRVDCGGGERSLRPVTRSRQFLAQRHLSVSRQSQCLAYHLIISLNFRIAIQLFEMEKPEKVRTGTVFGMPPVGYVKNCSWLAGLSCSHMFSVSVRLKVICPLIGTVTPARVPDTQPSVSTSVPRTMLNTASVCSPVTVQENQ